jgi:hypothetical protein
MIETTKSTEYQGQSSSPKNPGWETLMGIALDALRINPPLYASSVFGLPWTWLPPHSRYSEFKIIDLWRLRRTAKFLANIWIPSFPRTPPSFGPPCLNDLFWQPTVILQRPDHNGSYTTFPEEAWFFVNGIMTNDAVAQINSAYLADLFHRPLTMIQNSTDSLWADLFECALGKETYRVVEPAIKAFPPIYDALKNPHKERVVVICHSQGTIIMATVLRLLAELAPAEMRPPRLTAALESAPAPEARGLFEEAPRYAPPEFVYPDQEPINLDDFERLTRAELAKLEVYCFANCASTLPYIGVWDSRPVPWIENFGNEHDIVARLGMLAPRPEYWGIDIAGPRYMRHGAWGHLLNEHYLAAIERSQKSGRRPGGDGTSAPYEVVGGTPDAAPRLFDYINGGAPK